MRYLKAALILLVCIVLSGLLIHQFPQFEQGFVVAGMAIGVVLARREFRRG